MISKWLLVAGMGLLFSLGAGCGGDDDDDSSGGDGDADADADGVPAAPSNLDGTPMMDGLHLTWDDNSDDEDAFVVERAAAGGGEFEEIARTAADEADHHDAPLNAGTYTYRVSAENASGRSDAVEGTFEMP